MKLVFTE